VLVLDDLHLADDSTLSLVEELGEDLAGCPVMLVIIARPELLERRPAWSGSSYGRIELRNLPPADAALLLRGLLARCGDLPGEVVSDIVAATGGNPRLIVQLVHRMVADGAVDTAGPRWRLVPERMALSDFQFSIEEAVQARVAVLEPAERDLLEKAATFGNVFWLRGLVALVRSEKLEQATSSQTSSQAGRRFGPHQVGSFASDVYSQHVARLVAGLAERDYLLCLPAEDSTISGDQEIAFKHNLERDHVMRGTLPERRRRYSLVAAQWLESKLVDRSGEQMEYLAQLFERAGERRKAARRLLMAANCARERRVDGEAIDLYRRGIALLGQEPDLARADALLSLGDTLMLGGRADEARKCYEEMLEVAWCLDRDAEGGVAHQRIGESLLHRGQYPEALEHLAAAIDLMTRSRDLRGLARTLDRIGTARCALGEYQLAIEHHRRALWICRDLGDRQATASSTVWLAFAERDSGAFQDAIEHFGDSVEVLASVGEKQGAGLAMLGLGTIQAASGRVDLALEMLAKALEHANETGDRVLRARIQSSMAEVELELGRMHAATERLQEARAFATSTGDRLGMIDDARRAGEAALAVGRELEARQLAQESLELAQSAGLRPSIASALRLLGTVLSAFASSPADGELAERHLQKSVEILAAIGNDLELARTYQAMAELREQAGLLDEGAAFRSKAAEILDRLREAAALLP
ncbi:MAG: tetratricopeptide repeat protein, partial [Pseudomonadota bacterium]